jgi:hypothetical protein
MSRKGVTVMEEQKRYEDIDDFVFADEEYHPSEK